MKTSRRKMSMVQLTFVTAANMLGAGIIMLPTKLAEVGTISIISWIITSLGSLALALPLPDAACSLVSPAVWEVIPSIVSGVLDIS